MQITRQNTQNHVSLLTAVGASKENAAAPLPGFQAATAAALAATAFAETLRRLPPCSPPLPAGSEEDAEACWIATAATSAFLSLELAS